MGFLKTKGRLNCFTPEVALATFIIEIILAIYTFIKNKTSRSGLLSFFSLIALAMFQLSEFLICFGLNDKFWSIVGIVSITILPPLGLVMMSAVTGRTFWAKIYSFFAIIFIIIFVSLNKNLVDGTSCVGNYIIFRSLNEQLINIYKIFYYSGLSLALMEMLIGLRKYDKDILRKKYLKWFLFGYLSFMTPTSIIILIPSFSLQSLPSVLCGFAIVFAFVLAFKIAPIAKKLNI